MEVDVASGPITTATVEAATTELHRKHEQLYTFNMPWQGIEFLTFRVRATIRRTPFELPQVEAGDGDAELALKRQRTCWFDGVPVDTPVYDGALLRAGDTLSGPAIIEETTTTVVIPGRYDCAVDAQRQYILTRRAGAPDQAQGMRLEALAGGKV